MEAFDYKENSKLNAAIITLTNMVAAIRDHSIDIKTEDQQSFGVYLDELEKRILWLEENLEGEWEQSFASIQESFVQHRKNEIAYLKNITDLLKENLWSLVIEQQREIRRAIAEDKSLLKELKDLKQDIQKSKLPDLEKSFTSFGKVFTRMMNARESRFQKWMQATVEQIAYLQSKLEETESELAIDTLTKVANRRQFDSEIEKIAAKGRFAKLKPFLLMVDVDHFKYINDTFGHQAGDEVLERLGETLNSTFSGQGTLVARYGGEEFAVILSNLDQSATYKLASKLKDQISTLRFNFEGTHHKITVSIGVSQLDEIMEVYHWISKADKNLYKAKENGRNRIEF